MPSPADKEAFSQWQKELDENYSTMRSIAYGTVVIILLGVVMALIKLTFF